MSVDVGMHRVMVLDVHWPQVDQLVDGSLPPARQRQPRREGWRRKEEKSKATVKEEDKHEKPVAVEENSAAESLSR